MIKGLLIKGLILLAACSMLTLSVLGEAPVYSAVLSIEDVATLAKVIIDVGDEDVPEGATLIKAVFEPEDAPAPDLLTVIAVGSGMPEKIYLTPANGYCVTVELTPSLVPYRYMIIETKAYTVTAMKNIVVFTVSLGSEDTGPEEASPYRRMSTITNMKKGEPLILGQDIILEGVLEGFEGLTYTLQWQRNTGAVWENIPGENGLGYSFVLDEVNYYWYFRLVATIIDE